MHSKEQYRLNAKKVRDKRVSEHRCADCGNKLQDLEQYRCGDCKKKHNTGTKKAFDLLAKNGLCRICQQPLDDSGNKYHCKKCNEIDKLRVVKRVRDNKKKCIDFLGGKCNVCGLKTEFISVYDFHHKNPEEKEQGVRNLLGCVWEKLEKELTKCILVCANCHRIIHFEKDTNEY
jgi:hypothetical protein